MLEPLAGRLKWEQTAQGIRVAIPNRRGTRAYIYLPLIVLWLVIASLRYIYVFATPQQEDPAGTLQLIAAGLYALGLLFFLGWLAFTFTGETILSLDQDELRIERRVLGIELASRGFPTGQMSQLVYIPPEKLRFSRAVYDPNTSQIQFRSGLGLHSFARGITEGEASALILLMLEVYKFPDSIVPVIFDV